MTTRISQDFLGPIDKSFIGLSNVDNTSDLNKPISTTVQNALNLKANIAVANAVGITDTDTDMGTTPGTILSDNGTAKEWFAELESEVFAAENFAAPANTTMSIPYISRAKDTISALDLMQANGLADAVRNREATSADATEISDHFEEAAAYCAGSSRLLKVENGLFHLNRVIQVDAPLSILGNGAEQSRLQWVENSPGAGGMRIIAGDRSDRTQICDVGLFTGGVGVGQALEIDYSGTADNPQIRTMSRVLVRGLTMRGSDRAGVNGWRNGLKIINGIYMLINAVNFTGYGVAPQGPYNDGAGIWLTGESGHLYGPVSAYMNHIVAGVCGTSVRVENMEGVYLDQFEFVNCNYGLEALNDVPEPGWAITNGHINAYTRCMELKNLMEWNVSKILCYLSTTRPDPFTAINITGTGKTGQITDCQFKWALNNQDSTAIRVDGSSGLQIEGCNFDLTSSSASARSIEITTNATNTDIGENRFTAGLRPTSASPTTTFATRWAYSGSLNDITISSRRGIQTHHTVVGASNIPGGATAAGAVVQTFSSNNTSGYQIFRNGVGTNLWIRDYNGSWSSWKRINGLNGVDASATSISTTSAETLTVTNSKQVIRRIITDNVTRTITFSGSDAIEGDVFDLNLAFGSSASTTASYILVDNSAATLLTINGNSSQRKFAVRVAYTGTLWRIISAVESL